MYDWAPNPRWWEYEGLGDANSAAAAAGTGAAVVGSAVSAAAAAGLIAGAAVPFIGPAIAVVALGIELLIKNSGCGITCVETSQWANQAEPLLQQNIRAYFSQPAPRTQSSQQLALQSFDKVWLTLQQQCTQPGTGNAGVRCISDRQAGACTWKQSANSPLLSYPGEPQPGACWNWFSGYRDPIAHDPDVVPDAQLAAGAVSSVGGAISTDLASVTSSSWFLPAALVGGGILLYMAVK